MSKLVHDYESGLVKNFCINIDYLNSSIYIKIRNVEIVTRVSDEENFFDEVCSILKTFSNEVIGNLMLKDGRHIVLTKFAQKHNLICICCSPDGYGLTDLSISKLRAMDKATDELMKVVVETNPKITNVVQIEVVLDFYSNSYKLNKIMRV